MKANTKGNLIIGAGVVVLLALVVSWGVNIYKLFTAASIGGMEVARAIGVFMAPLGSVLGFF